MIDNNTSGKIDYLNPSRLIKQPHLEFNINRSRSGLNSAIESVNFNSLINGCGSVKHDDREPSENNSNMSQNKRKLYSMRPTKKLSIKSKL